jgi:hypothetical protein
MMTASPHTPRAASARALTLSAPTSPSTKANTSPLRTQAAISLPTNLPTSFTSPARAPLCAARPQPSTRLWRKKRKISSTVITWR